MTRFWAQGLAIDMVLDDENEPHAFIWSSRKHTVSETVNDWLVDIEWWRYRVWRHYYKLITDTGLLVIIFHDLMTEDWFLQRLYD